MRARRPLCLLVLATAGCWCWAAQAGAYAYWGSISTAGPSLGFGVQPLDTFGPPQSLTLTNSGHGDLRIGHAQLSSGDTDDFLISSDGCSYETLPVGADCTIHVRFGPSQTGARAATLSVPSDAPASSVQIALSGTGGQLPQGPPGATGRSAAPPER